MTNANITAEQHSKYCNRKHFIIKQFSSTCVFACYRYFDNLIDKQMTSMGRHVPQGPKSEASAYFFFPVNTLAKSNNFLLIFGTLKRQFISNIALNDIYSYSI